MVGSGYEHRNHLGSADYKRALATVYVKRALLEAYTNGVNHAK